MNNGFACRGISAVLCAFPTPNLETERRDQGPFEALLYVILHIETQGKNERLCLELGFCPLVVLVSQALLHPGNGDSSPHTSPEER